MKRQTVREFTVSTDPCFHLLHQIPKSETNVNTNPEWRTTRARTPVEVR